MSAGYQSRLVSNLPRYVRFTENIECDFKIHPECLDVTDAFPCPKTFDTTKIRHAFLNVFTSIMRNYSKFFPLLDKIFSIEDADSLEQIYHTNNFLLDLDVESRQFMEKFSASQSFYVFIRERHPGVSKHDPSIIFFDECIKAKRNRSILTLQKEMVDFLTDESCELHHSILYDGPNKENIGDMTCSKFLKI